MKTIKKRKERYIEETVNELDKRLEKFNRDFKITLKAEFGIPRVFHQTIEIEEINGDLGGER